MIWVGWLILTVALAYFSPSLERRALLTIAAGLLAMAAGHLVFHPIAYWVFSALLWICIGILVFTTNGGNFANSALFLILSGVLKLPGRLSGVDYEFGNVWLFWSDMAGLAALLLLGRPVFSDIRLGIGRLGQRYRIGGISRVSNRESDPR